MAMFELSTVRMRGERSEAIAPEAEFARNRALELHRYGSQHAGVVSPLLGCSAEFYLEKFHIDGEFDMLQEAGQGRMSRFKDPEPGEPICFRIEVGLL